MVVYHRNHLKLHVIIFFIKSMEEKFVLNFAPPRPLDFEV